MSCDPEAFAEAVAKYLAHIKLESAPEPELQQGTAELQQESFVGVNLDITPEEAEFVPANDEERHKYDLYKNHNASYAMILNTEFKKETDSNAGQMRIMPRDPTGYFPYLIDFVNEYDDLCRIPDVAPEFKVTRNVIKKVSASEPVDETAVPEPFNEDDEFDIRNYLLAYTYTIVYLYGDGKLNPTSQEIKDYTICIVNYIAKISTKSKAEVLETSKPGKRFHDQFPDNFITKYVMSQPEPEQHPLYWQFMNCSIPAPNNKHISCSYLYHAYAITPSRMWLLTKLNTMGAIKLDPFMLKCYGHVSKFIKYDKDGLERFPIFRI